MATKNTFAFSDEVTKHTRVVLRKFSWSQKISSIIVLKVIFHIYYNFRCFKLPQDNFQWKKWYYSYFCSKHRLWEYNLCFRAVHNLCFIVKIRYTPVKVGVNPPPPPHPEDRFSRVIFNIIYFIWRKPIFGVLRTTRHRPACAYVQFDQRLCYNCNCSWAGWFESHFVRRPGFSRPYLFYKLPHLYFASILPVI